MVRPPSRSPARAIVLACCLLLFLSLAGCLGGSEAGETSGTPTGVGPADQNVTPTDESTNLSDASPEERAQAAEEDYITDRLESAPCVNSWGLAAYGGIYENATISERTDEGVYVDVSHPYWYGTNRDVDDGGTRAEYLVTEESLQRVDGDELEPC